MRVPGDPPSAVTEFTGIESNDGRTYNEHSTTEQGYPAAVVTVHDTDSSDMNIIDSQKGATFDLDLDIPAGVYYCLKVDLFGRFATNNIYVSSPDYQTVNADNAPYYLEPRDSLLGNSLVKYFGTDAEDKLVMADSITDGLWIYSDKVTTLHIEGARDRNGLGNSGHLYVTVVMKPTATP